MLLIIATIVLSTVSFARVSWNAYTVSIIKPTGRAAETQGIAANTQVKITAPAAKPQIQAATRVSFLTKSFTVAKTSLQRGTSKAPTEGTATTGDKKEGGTNCNCEVRKAPSARVECELYVCSSPRMNCVQKKKAILCPGPAMTGPVSFAFPMSSCAPDPCKDECILSFMGGKGRSNAQTSAELLKCVAAAEKTCQSWFVTEAKGYGAANVPADVKEDQKVKTKTGTELYYRIQEHAQGWDVNGKCGKLALY